MLSGWRYPPPHSKDLPHLLLPASQCTVITPTPGFLEHIPNRRSCVIPQGHKETITLGFWEKQNSFGFMSQSRDGQVLPWCSLRRRPGMHDLLPEHFWVAAMPQRILHPSPLLLPGRCCQQKGCPSPAGSGASSMRCRHARTSLGCSTCSTRPCGRCGARRSGTFPCGRSSSPRSGPARPWPRRWPCPPTTAWPPAPSTPSPPSTTRRCPRWPRPSWSPSSPRGLRAKGRLPRSPC